ncbi:MAG: methylated-DNA--[protein]-cysteine S-methyltransferase, partial [Gammaproteobacteria bacterium]
MSGTRKFQFISDSPIGSLGVSLSGNRVCGVEFIYEHRLPVEPHDPFANEVLRQLQDCFQPGFSGFSLPLDLVGSDFQQLVWRALAKIKPGSVRTYGEIARELHTSPRAVGNACRSNPVPLIIPCHRVVAAAGIGGF